MEPSLLAWRPAICAPVVCSTPLPGQGSKLTPPGHPGLLGTSIAVVVILRRNVPFGSVA